MTDPEQKDAQAPADQPMVDDAVVDDSGVPLPATIELVESSGPVPPAHQYETTVRVFTAGGAGEAVTLSHRDLGSYDADGVAARDIDARCAVPLDAYKQLWADLLSKGIRQCHGDLIGEAARLRTGVSFNHVQVRLADKLDVRFDYLLLQLEDEAEYERQRDIVELLKSFPARVSEE